MKSIWIRLGGSSKIGELLSTEQLKTLHFKNAMKTFLFYYYQYLILPVENPWWLKNYRSELQ